VTRRPAIELRCGAPRHARRLHALIAANLAEGRLLPRTLSDLRQHASRFVIALKGRTIVGCAELAPLSPSLAEVRSLVVDPAARGLGIGRLLVDELRRRGHRAGFDRLCAFTHCPGYFTPLGFTIAPHASLNEKVTKDCVACPQFGQCHQHALVLALDDEHAGDSPRARLLPMYQLQV
jgi:amino-acid N-acetyltransferase